MGTNYMFNQIDSMIKYKESKNNTKANDIVMTKSQVGLKGLHIINSVD